MTTRMRVAKINKEELERRCADGSMYADFVPIGHWIDRFGGEYRCSECGAKISEEDITDTPIKSFNFCPFCGADMREGDAE